MRITGGVLRSRLLTVPAGQRVRPTQDRVREALFSALAPRISGCRFLDLFGGSGAVGLEAWSRGAACVCWVESDARVMTVLRRNVELLCNNTGRAEPGGDRQLVKADVLRFVARGCAGEAFDVIFADPPYDREGTHKRAEKVLESVAQGAWLAAEGILVLEQATEEAEVVSAGWAVTSQRVYGGTRLSLLVRG